MHDAGFTAYDEEWWHFDRGDQFWGLFSGREAVYGPAAAPPA
jgi:D-alanyl-D-alanine dipeptidase